MDDKSFNKSPLPTFTPNKNCLSKGPEIIFLIYEKNH